MRWSMHRHRRVALDAEVAELAVGLALTALVHRDEHRVLRGVGVHAAGPLAVVNRVAPLHVSGSSSCSRVMAPGWNRGSGVAPRARTTCTLRKCAARALHGRAATAAAARCQKARAPRANGERLHRPSG